MASAQVMRKQEHLEAGKRKLEEFRRKKAAERAKKATENNQLHASNGSLHENQLSESGHVRNTDSEGADPSDGVGGAGFEPPGGIANNDVKNHVSSSGDTSEIFSFSSNNLHSNPLGPLPSHLKENEFGDNDASEPLDKVDIIYNHQEKKENDGASGRDVFGMERDHPVASHLSSVQEIDNTSNHSNYSDTSHSSSINISHENSISAFTQDKSGYNDRLADSTTSSYVGSMYSSISNSFSEIGQRVGVDEPSYPTSLRMGESNFAGSSQVFSDNNLSPWPSDSKYAGSGFSATPSTAGNSNRRSRPSFLDSINMSKGPSASSSLLGSLKAEPFGSVIHPVDSLGSSVAQNSMNSSVASGNEVGLVSNTGSKHDFYSQKQNEDFAALEQHIEDLTQEKFSLQRALEASRTLAESLAAENSALPDTYNQQGSIVNQLKSDMENLQEEIKAQLVELETVKLEYANAQLECNAADDRAKLLASEVIGLEEKALRLRSNELKLERELENSQAEFSSLKKKMSSLEKERRDLRSTIDALQEEKKLLQSKVRKASASGNFGDSSKNVINKKDVSTSTGDLGGTGDAAPTRDTNNLDTTASLGNNSSNFSFLDDNRQLSLDELSLTIPPDQMRMIQNINTLMSELAMEKEELIQALSAELSQSYKLKELNKELTRKLEAQTQRLELLTAQSMANDNILLRPPDSRNMHDNNTYADEGDEVVERVLGWIMKLFPGGPSKRRTSKLL